MYICDIGALLSRSYISSGLRNLTTLTRNHMAAGKRLNDVNTEIWTAGYRCWSGR